MRTEEMAVRKHKIDLRNVPEGERNVVVFQTFESIQPGTIFILIDNKELSDIHGQFRHDFPGHFEWKDLDRGPEIWRAEIAKFNGHHFAL